ncbi:hypothetical protein HYY75_05365 [bacterium]|nr:hypothetical protein [bacterium]
MRKIREGYVLPLVLAAGVSIAFFIFAISRMGRGYSDQLTRMNLHQSSFLIAYSGYSKILARLYNASWSERFFKSAPFKKMGISLFGGKYDIFAENTPGKDFQADIYVRVKLEESSYLYFWRIFFNDDLFDISNRFYPILFKMFDSQDFPKGESGTLASKVDELLNKRLQNQESSAEKARLISTLVKPSDMVKVLGARAPGAQDVPDLAQWGTYPGEIPQIPSLQGFVRPEARQGFTPPPFPSKPPPPPVANPNSPQTRLLNTFYQTYLGRNVTPEEMAANLDAFTRGDTPEDFIENTFLNSIEYNVRQILLREGITQATVSKQMAIGGMIERGEIPRPGEMGFEEGVLSAANR